MGARTMTMPPLPAGFQLVEPPKQAATGTIPPLPAGFVLAGQEKAKPKDNSFDLGAAITGAGQGASFGFGDEIIAGLGAAGAYAMDKLGVDTLAGKELNKSLSDYYTQNLEKGRAQIREQQEQSPVSFGVGEVAGALGTGVAGATTKGGAALARGLSSGGTAARIGKAVGTGAVSGGVYGLGTGEGGAEGRIASAGEGALIGGAIGGAIPAVSATAKGALRGTKTIAQGAKVRAPEALDESLAAIQERASNAYKAMRESGAVMTKKASTGIMNTVDDAIAQAGPLNKRIHRKSLSVIKDMRDLAKKGNLGLEELDQYRRLFGELTGDFNNKSNARLAGIIKNSIDDSLDALDDSAFKAGSKQAVDALKTGRAEYARARKFEQIADIVKKSDGDANYVKRELKKIIDNPKKRGGWSADELAALKEAGTLGGGEAVLKILGKFGFDPARLGSGVGAIFGGTGGAIVGGGTGAAIVPAVGTGARYVQKGLQRGKTENLLQTIEGAAPKARGAGGTTPSLPGSGGAGAAAESRIPAQTTPALPQGFQLQTPKAAPAPKPQASSSKGILENSVLDATKNTNLKSPAKTPVELNLKVQKQTNLNELLPEELKKEILKYKNADEFADSLLLRGDNPKLNELINKDIKGNYREILINKKNELRDKIFDLKQRAEAEPKILEDKNFIKKATDLEAEYFKIDDELFYYKPKNYFDFFEDGLSEGRPKAKSIYEELSNSNKPRSNNRSEFFDKLAMAESGGNPNAKAKTSSASGLYQFTDGTWRAMVKKYGKQDGVTIAQKNDPKAQHKMVKRLTEENADILRKKTGIEPSDGDLYIAHFMGPAGAVRLLNSPSNAVAAQLFKREAAANRPIFYHKGGKPRTVAEVYDLLTNKVA